MPTIPVISKAGLLIMQPSGFWYCFIISAISSKNNTMITFHWNRRLFRGSCPSPILHMQTQKGNRRMCAGGIHVSTYRALKVEENSEMDGLRRASLPASARQSKFNHKETNTLHLRLCSAVLNHPSDLRQYQALWFRCLISQHTSEFRACTEVMVLSSYIDYHLPRTACCWEKVTGLTASRNETPGT